MSITEKPWYTYLSPRFDSDSGGVSRGTSDGWRVSVRQYGDGFMVACDSPAAKGVIVCESILSARDLAEALAAECGGWEAAK